MARKGVRMNTWWRIQKDAMWFILFLVFFSSKIYLTLTYSYFEKYYWLPPLIDLVTVFDAILTSRQTREKLQCLYENLMLDSFSRDFLSKTQNDSSHRCLPQFVVKKVMNGERQTRQYQFADQSWSTTCVRANLSPEHFPVRWAIIPRQHQLQKLVFTSDTM